jgi:hypothetical protein
MKDKILEQTVFNPTPYPENEFTIRDLCSGVQIFGGTGSGKSSGSGQTIAVNILKLKKQIPEIGGLILTAKGDETAHWLKIMADVGIKQEDIILFGTDGKSSFDFLAYEFTRNDATEGKVINVVKAMKIIAEVAQSEKSSIEAGDNFYWLANASILLTHLLNLLYISGMEVSIANLHKMIASIPEDIAIARKRLRDYEVAKLNFFKKHNASTAEQQRLDLQQEFLKTLPFLEKCYSICEYVYHNADTRGVISDAEMQDIHLAFAYLLEEYPAIASRTRSSIDVMVRLMYYPFTQGQLRQLFTRANNVSPDDIFAGKIIIVNLPVLQYNELGRIAQALWKYFIQKAIERRKIEDNTAPVFIWADESQYFINEHDQLFLTTARSQRCMSIYLTQNVENYITRLGENRTYAMLGNFQTKIFHQNSDLKTNEYASKVIGKRWQEKESYTLGETVSNNMGVNTSFGINQSVGSSGTSAGNSYNVGLSASRSKSFNSSTTINQMHEYLVQPYSFNCLTNGTSKHDYKVQAFLYKAGQQFVINKKIFHSRYLSKKYSKSLSYKEIAICASFDQRINKLI